MNEKRNTTLKIRIRRKNTMRDITSIKTHTRGEKGTLLRGAQFID